MVVLAVLSLILGAGIILGLLNGTNPLMLVAIGIFATALIALARSRTKSLELELPQTTHSPRESRSFDLITSLGSVCI